MAKIVVGIPCYRDVAAETLQDYMRFAYYLGRRCPDHEFFLDIKTKSEQFRARTAIVEASLQVGADYLLFLDDDHVIDWEDAVGPNPRYGFILELLAHMQVGEKRAIVGALYYHRGGDCMPVVMKEGKDGGFYYLRDDEITSGLQEVAVQGGGCMLVDMNLFSVIPQPWFEPEHRLGTDLQLCKKAREHGFTVWCDTSIVIGHVKSSREIITPRTRHRIIGETAGRGVTEGVNQSALASGAYNLYRMDAQEYLQMDWNKILGFATLYNTKYMPTFSDYADPKEYYRSLGGEQIARQVWFHSLPEMLDQMQFITSVINTNVDAHGLDYGCGSAPVGMELALRGHRMDFIDVDGAPGYEFAKWRAIKRGINNRCGWCVQDDYDYCLMLDSIEHIKDWESVLELITSKLKDNGFLLTNYFLNNDFANVEHISMDHQAVKEFLVSHGLYPMNQIIWIKRDLGFMDQREQRDSAA